MPRIILEVSPDLYLDWQAWIDSVLPSATQAHLLPLPGDRILAAAQQQLDAYDKKAERYKKQRLKRALLTAMLDEDEQIRSGST